MFHITIKCYTKNITKIITGKKNWWEKALRRDTVFPWTKLLTIYFQHHL